MAEKKTQGGAKKQSGAQKKTETVKKQPSEQKNARTANKKSSDSSAQTEKPVVHEQVREKDTSSAGNQLVVVLLAAIALFVSVCFIFKNDVGVVGRWIADGCFGLFGFGAIMIPILLCQLALFWKRDVASGAVKYKYIVAIFTMLVISVISHAIWSMAAKLPDYTFSQALAWDNIKSFFINGMEHKGGGFIGGYLATLMICALGYPGTLIFGFLFLIVFLLSLFGLTFSECIRRYRFYRQLSRNDRRVKAEAKKQQLDVEDDDFYEEEPQPRSARSARPQRQEEEPVYASVPQERTVTKTKKQDEHPKKHASIDRDIFAEDAEFGKAEKVVSDEVIAAKKNAKHMPKELPEVAPVPREQPFSREKVRDEAVLSRYVGYEDSLFDDTLTRAQKERPARSKAIGERTGEDNLLIEDENLFSMTAPQEALPTQQPEKTSPAVRQNAKYPRKAAQDIAHEQPSAPIMQNREKDVPPIQVLPVTKETAEEEFASEEEVPNEISILPPDALAEIPATVGEEDEDVVPPRPVYEFPPIDILNIGEQKDYNENVSAELRENADKIIQTLESFHVHVTISHVSRGPTVTRYELEPAAGTRVRSIMNLLDDIALSLATNGVRSDGIITGKSAIGIEVPNKVTNTVYVRELIEDKRFMDAKSRLTTCLGMDVSGAPVYLDIAKMPHLMIAGATGMGKSVCINSLLVSLLYKARPDEVKLILIDPKKVELNIYNGIPHLLVPVVFDAKKAAGSLHWAVTEMERRFELIEAQNTRNIAQYNASIADDPQKEFLPQIVIIIDELADLMMSAPDDVEASICRLAQKARAAGMHLIIGTQRPSVDVITGLIKANIPSRIAFTVASQIDSRTIIDSQGAEKLIGKGDMLYAPVGASKPIRVQGSFVSESEIEEIVGFIKENSIGADYSNEVMAEINRAAETAGQKKGKGAAAASDGDADDNDPMLNSAIELAVESGKISTSLIQRRLSLGYGRAAKLIDILERRGIVSPPEGQKPRTVLITREQFMEMQMREADHHTDGDA